MAVSPFATLSKAFEVAGDADDVRLVGFGPVSLVGDHIPKGRFDIQTAHAQKHFGGVGFQPPAIDIGGLVFGHMDPCQMYAGLVCSARPGSTSKMMPLVLKPLACMDSLKAVVVIWANSSTEGVT